MQRHTGRICSNVTTVTQLTQKTSILIAPYSALHHHRWTSGADIRDFQTCLLTLVIRLQQRRTTARLISSQLTMQICFHHTRHTQTRSSSNLWCHFHCHVFIISCSKSLLKINLSFVGMGNSNKDSHSWQYFPKLTVTTIQNLILLTKSTWMHLHVKLIGLNMKEK